jgi:DNA polymerase III subunit delta'
VNPLSWTNLALDPYLIQLFHNLLTAKRLAHAYLFHGPETAQKKPAALELAKAINCEHSPGDACDQCPTCRQIMHDNHPDVVTIAPQGNGIKIDQLRELKHRFHYQATANFTRVVIIEHAEQMRVEAANSLLKFLEEPPSPLVAILLTTNAQAILPTIQSRCQTVRFRTSKEAVQHDYHEQQKFPPHLAQLAAQFSQSLPLDAVQFSTLCQHSIAWSAAMLTGQRTQTLQMLLQIAEQDTAQVALQLDTLLFWWRELLYWQNTGQTQHFAHWADEVKQQSTQGTMATLLLMSENAMIARRLLDKAGLRSQTILEQMLLAIERKELSQANGWELIML